MKILVFKIASLLMITGILSSCSKKIDEAYQNPNSDVRVPVESLLPQITAAMAANAAGHGTANDARYIGQYIQNWHWSGATSNYDRMGYTNNVADVAQSTWRMHYFDIGQNNVKMIEWATEEKKWDYVGVGQAIFAWSWLTLTDYYGDVILKDAFNTDKLTFSYSTQPEVYDYVRELCFKALENLNKTGDNVSQANLAKGDAYFYNGDVNKWKKFVYAVLARYYNHQSNKATYKPDSVIYYAKLSILTNADNATVKFANTGNSATANFFGPLRNNFSSSTNGITNPVAVRQSAYIANLLTGSNTALSGVNDPRTWYMLRGNSNGTIRGLLPSKGQANLPAKDRPENFFGISQETAINNGAPTNDNGGRYIFRNGVEFPIILASEVQFMMAEAAHRKGDKATAYTAYKEGISLHFDLLTSKYNGNIPSGKEITSANKASYLADPKVVPATETELTLTKIMLQKYIALWGHGVLETWVDMRRYHYNDIDAETNAQVYADFTPPSGSDLFPDNNGELVYRVRPRFNSEYLWNILELQRIGADKGNYHTKRMWFSEK